MAAARGIAREHWNEKFSPAEQLEASEKRATIQSRMATETLFSSGPDSKPELYDTRSSFTVLRSPEEMDAARNRLHGLRFSLVKLDNVESYVNDLENCVVYADPRAKGNIDFKAYRRVEPSTAKGKAKFKLIGHFRIPDRWKNDLNRKYLDWVLALTAPK